MRVEERLDGPSLLVNRGQITPFAGIAEDTNRLHQKFRLVDPSRRCP
jgi:hypothetical protein